jgi:hypothetical protein
MSGMKYMVLMYSEPAETKAMSASDREAVRRRHEALHADESEAMLNGAGLAYPERTMTIRLDSGRPVASEGPFMAGREQLTAYYVIDCESAEHAASIAERILDFHVTAMEVREIHDWFGMGPDPPEPSGESAGLPSIW